MEYASLTSKLKFLDHTAKNKKVKTFSFLCLLQSFLGYSYFKKRCRKKSKRLKLVSQDRKVIWGFIITAMY